MFVFITINIEKVCKFKLQNVIFFSNEPSFELITPAVAGKINIRLD